MKRRFALWAWLALAGMVLGGCAETISGVAPSTEDGATPTDSSRPDTGMAPRDTSVDSGTDSTSADRALITEPTLSVAYDGPAASALFAGRYRQVVYRFRTATMRDLVTNGLPFQIEALDERTLVSTAGNPLVRNIQLLDERSGRTVSLMLELPRIPGSRSAMLRFPRTFAMMSGETSFAIAVDVPYTLDEGQAGTRIRVTVGESGRFFTNGSVQTTEGVMLAPEAIAGNVTIPGNIHTVYRASAYLSLGSGPTERVIVSHAINRPSVEIGVSAGIASDIQHTGRFRLYGRGNTGGGLRFQDFQDVVTGCRLMTGSEVLSTAMVPNADGMMDFTVASSLIVRRGTTAIYTAECSTDSVVSEMGDQFVIGMRGPDDIGFRDTDGPSPDILIGPALASQLTSTPSVIMTVVRSGAFTIMYDGALSAHDVTPEPGVWYIAAPYRASTTLKSQTARLASVTWTGPSACVNSIGVASMGRLLGQMIPPTGMGGTVDVELVTPLTISGGSNAPLQVWVQLAPTGVGCPSGTVITAGLASGQTTEEWTGYGSRYDIRVDGDVSGERIYPEGIPRLGEPLTLR